MVVIIDYGLGYLRPLAATYQYPYQTEVGEHNLRVVKSMDDHLLVERGSETDLHPYLVQEEQEIICWLEYEKTVELVVAQLWSGPPRDTGRSQ